MPTETKSGSEPGLRNTGGWPSRNGLVQRILHALGAEIYEWLEGNEGWLTCARPRGGDPPWLLEVSVPLEPNALEAAFLEVPWELLADEADHLAARRDLVFCPLRRIGDKGGEAEPPSGRLQAVFMAAAPEGEWELDFEQEERAVLEATGSIGMDLVVEESGNLAFLAGLLALHKVDILHLSCHGSAEPPPSLLLETDLGEPAPATAEDIDRCVRANRPHLLFLSACQSAAADQILGCLAASLVSLGIPALLGWGASVQDNEAIQFATHLYRGLARFQRLDEAVAYARLDLLESQRPSHDWHQARLFLGRSDGGALTARGVHVKEYTEKPKAVFFDQRRKQIPVAGPKEFVGRRRPLQQILRAFREGRSGVLIHGIGRQGKSSLAYRVWQRMSQYKEVIFDCTAFNFSGPSILDEIADSVADPKVYDWVNRHRDNVQDSRRLSFVLVEFLENFCDQAPDGGSPLLFVLDDFERLLESSDSAPKRVRASAVEPLQALLWAVGRAASQSKIIITSRFTFTLGRRDHDLAKDLVWVALEAMTASDSRKQVQTKLRLLGPQNQDVLDENQHLKRLVEVGRGNPGLQDLLTRLIVSAPGDADQILAEAERHVQGKGAATRHEILSFFENLDIGSMVGLLSELELELLRLSTLFEVPIPRIVMDQLAYTLKLVSAESPPSQRLIGLGLWELHDPERQPSVLLNRLARPQAGELDVEEAESIARTSLDHLSKFWIERRGQDLVLEQDLQLTRLALLAHSSGVLASTAEGAVRALEAQQKYREAAVLGEVAVSALDEAGCEAPYGLLTKAGQLCHQVGRGASARRLLDRAYQRLRGAIDRGDTVEMKDLGTVLGLRSQLLIQDGLVEGALESLGQAREIYETLNLKRERAVILGYIARIYASRGDVEDALALHKEQLRDFEVENDASGLAWALGDVATIRFDRGQVEEALLLHEQRLRILEPSNEREWALALGDVARIKASGGEIETALLLHNQRLQIFEALTAPRERAVTLGDIARIKALRGEFEAALSLHLEALQVFEESPDIRSRAVTLRDMAKIRTDLGELDAALSLLEDARGAFESLGDVLSKVETECDIARIKQLEGLTEEALALLKEALPRFKSAGYSRQWAITLGDIARINASSGGTEEALLQLGEVLQIFQGLKDVREEAVTKGAIARIKTAQGEIEEALDLHGQALHVFTELKDIKERAMTLRSMARIRATLDQKEEALSLHRLTLLASDSLNDLRERSVTLRDIARIEASGGLWLQAEPLYQEALRGFESVGDSQECTVTRVDLMEATASLGYTEKALTLRNEVERSLGTLKDLSRRVHVLWRLGQMVVANGAVADGLEKLKQAYEISLTLGHLDSISIIGFDLGRTLCAQGASVQGCLVLKRARDGFRKLRQPNWLAEVEVLLDQFSPAIHKPTDAEEDSST